LNRLAARANATDAGAKTRGDLRTDSEADAVGGLERDDERVRNGIVRDARTETSG
jgi:hypothetical protein